MDRRSTLWLVMAVSSCFTLTRCAQGGAPVVETHSADPSSKRMTASGELVGFAAKNHKAQTWLGIPFAKPPVGELRWRAPQAPASWTGVREALRFGSACPQFANALSDAPSAAPDTVTGHEDCLYLNVYAPQAPAEEAVKRKLPVMVWFHGGGNSVGHAGTYDGSELAARYDVVVVTTNYRLGPFGWFRHPALIAEGQGDEQSGNWGTLDLIRALQWVKENAAAFGGDAGNVTIFGESAGGSDVFSLLVSKRAEGLFHRAIVESGGLRSRSLAEAQNPTDAQQPGAKSSSAEATLRILFPELTRDKALGQAKGLEAKEIAARLRAASPARVFAAYQVGAEASVGGMIDMPILLRDGYTLPVEQSAQLLAQGNYNRVPVMLGTNRDEMKLFMMGDVKLVRRWVRPLPVIRDENRYQVISDYASLAWKMTGADDPAADIRKAQGPSVYVYRFDWDEEPKILWSDFAKLLGAGHGMEVAFVFRNVGGGPFARLFTDANRARSEQLADAMSSYWANFAYAGAPGHGRDGKLPEWRPVDPGQGGDKQMIFDTTAGGGVRMDNHAVSKPALLAQLAHDRRTDEPLRCEIFDAMLQRGTVDPNERASAGCSASAKAR